MPFVNVPSRPLLLAGPYREEVVMECGEWQASNVTDNTLKAAFRQVCDAMLENGSLGCYPKGHPVR